MSAVAAVLVRVVAADEARIALAQLVAVGVFAQAKDRQRPPLSLAEPRCTALADMPKSGRYRVERIGKVAPTRRRIGTVRGKLPARALPPGKRRLRVVDLVRGHALEVIVLRIMFADMVEAQETQSARAVEIGRLQRGLEFAGRVTAGYGAYRLRPLDPSVHPGLLRRHQIPLYRANERTDNRTGRD